MLDAVDLLDRFPSPPVSCGTGIPERDVWLREVGGQVLPSEQPVRRVYSWSGHGNIGDDWIHEVAAQYINVVPVREVRSVRHPLNYELADPGAGSSRPPLLLWGGGWLASDRSGSRTLKRWSGHVRRERVPVTGFGLGVGPFQSGGVREATRRDRVLGTIEHLSVRTERDLEILKGLHPAVLACDPTILDKRFYDKRWVEGLPRDNRESGDYAVFTMPGWRPHWERERPWLTERNYQSLVKVTMKEVGLPIKHVIFDRSQNNADEVYWRDLGGDVVRPKSPLEAAAVFAGASRAIVGRLHAAIMCALLGVPSVVIPYHHKFDLLRELGLAILGPEDFSSEERVWSVSSASHIETVRARGEHVLTGLLGQSGERG